VPGVSTTRRAVSIDAPGALANKGRRGSHDPLGSGSLPCLGAEGCIESWRIGAGMRHLPAERVAGPDPIDLLVGDRNPIEQYPGASVALRTRTCIKQGRYAELRGSVIPSNCPPNRG